MIEFDPVLVHEWLSRSARRFPEKTALICNDRKITYRELDHLSDQCGGVLMEKGVSRGDRVIIFMDNSPEVVIALYGILKAGGVFVILEGSMKTPKLGYIIQNAGTRMVIAHAGKRKIVQDAVQSTGSACKVLWVCDRNQRDEHEETWDKIITWGEKRILHPFPRGIDIDLATVIYTSGSTGEPKGVMSTHHNMISAARSIIQYIGNSEDDIILTVLPLSFDYGLYQVIMSVMFGGTVVIERSFMYSEQLLKRLTEEKITGFPVVPTILAMLLRLESLPERDFSSLRYITNTGAALPVEHIRKLRKLFPHISLFSMFGLTECKRVSFLPPDKVDERPESVGIAMPNCETVIVDENGKSVPAGTSGQLVVRGANVMQGYWKDSETTRRIFQDGRYPAERLLFTGDYFHKDDDGFLYFEGRKDDLIKSRGERVSIREVERALMEMTGVAETAVVALPDEILGQAIAAFVVSVPGIKLDRGKVLQYCTSQLEANKIPKYVWFPDRIPRLENGKVDLKQLRILAEEFRGL